MRLDGWGKTNNENNFNINDDKLYKRECIRLENILKASNEYEDKEIILAIHFPPYMYKPFMDIIKEYKVDKCIYGHLHGDGLTMVKEGIINNTEYIMVSCDYTKFKVVKL